MAIAMTSDLGDLAGEGAGAWACTRAGADTQACWAGVVNGASTGTDADAGASWEGVVYRASTRTDADAGSAG
jgi:hypothetical protein